MDSLGNPGDMMLLASAVLMLVLSANERLQLTCNIDTEEEREVDVTTTLLNGNNSSLDIDTFTRAALHTFRITILSFPFDEDLGYWVKPRSTTWFSRFLVDQYEDERWIQMFRMSKSSMFSLAELLRPLVFKKNTTYCLAIPVLVRVACTLFKLTHGAPLLLCSEMFAVGKSTVSVVLREVVHSINIVLRSEIVWPTGDNLLQIEADFKYLCGLPGVVGVIDGTHVSISKPRYGPADYFYYKSGGYTLNCQGVVDSKKRFLDLYLGMPGSTKDSRMLRRSALYHRAMHSRLWDAGVTFHGFSPFLLADGGYPLLPWLMVPHEGHEQLPVANTLFNSKLRRGRAIVENAFAMLKQSFRELLVKSNLDVTFMPDVILACALLHNMLLGQSHEDVERLLDVLRSEGSGIEVVQDEPVPPLIDETVGDELTLAHGEEKCEQLGVYLALQRHIIL